MKVCFRGNHLHDYPDIVRVDIEAKMDRLLFDEVGRIGAGGNSGFQALNIAAQLGADRIILVGFDMNDDHPQHWYGRNRWPMANNPDRSNFRRWRDGFGTAAAQLRAMGVRVVNASPKTALTCFPVMGLDEAMKELSV